MKKIICLYGLAASGKTTQADLLVKKYNFHQFGMGDRLRAEITAQTEVGKQIEKTVAQGLLVPDHLIAEILKGIQKPAQETGIIFDGFPRMIPQADLLGKILQEVNLEVDLFILLDIGAEEARRRIAARAAATGRSDDQDIEVVNNRLAVFNKESESLIKYYQTRNKFIRLNGELPISEVFKEIEKYIF